MAARVASSFQRRAHPLIKQAQRAATFPFNSHTPTPAEPQTRPGTAPVGHTLPTKGFCASACVITAVTKALLSSPTRRHLPEVLTAYMDALGTFCAAGDSFLRKANELLARLSCHKILPLLSTHSTSPAGPVPCPYVFICATPLRPPRVGERCYYSHVIDRQLRPTLMFCWPDLTGKTHFV